MIVGVTEDCTKKYDAVEIVGIGAKILGGSKGGGRKDLAQSGGTNTKSTGAAIQAIEKFL
jgi:alanyl-tRNA synthetase